MPDRTTTAQAWPYASTDPAAWLRAWGSVYNFAPNTLQQPINTGWSFGPTINVNSGNSTSPQVEAEVLQRHSYGRQIGRISDALAALIGERGAAAASDPRYAKFLQMKAEVDAIKADVALQRIEQLRGELAVLKTERPAEHRRLLKALRELLAD